MKPKQCRFKVQHFVDVDVFQITFVSGVYSTVPISETDIGAVLLLFHQLGDTLAVFQLATSGFVQVRCKLRKRRQFTILRKRQFDPAGDLLHERDLG